MGFSRLDRPCPPGRRPGEEQDLQQESQGYRDREPADQA